MQTKEVQLLAERRAYYRLLRRLLTEEVQSAYSGDADSVGLPSNISSLMTELENRQAQDGPTARAAGDAPFTSTPTRRG